MNTIDNKNKGEKESFQTRQQIADSYNICVRTLNRQLSRYGVRLPRGLISPLVRNKIHQILGEPCNK